MLAKFYFCKKWVLHLGKGGIWHTFLVDGDDDSYCPSSSFGVVNGGSSLRP
jgi:hypothetical protein